MIADHANMAEQDLLSKTDFGTNSESSKDNVPFVGPTDSSPFYDQGNLPQ